MEILNCRVTKAFFMNFDEWKNGLLKEVTQVFFVFCS